MNSICVPGEEGIKIAYGQGLYAIVVLMQETFLVIRGHIYTAHKNERLSWISYIAFEGCPYIPAFVCLHD